VKTGKDTCWAWLGSSGPNTNLFGAHKNNKGQMTQARRILYRDITGDDCDDLQITMRCKNAYCMNFGHMDITPNRRKYYSDGVLRGTREQEDKTAGLQRRTLKQIDKDWDKR
jgi:hypothetical protein